MASELSKSALKRLSRKLWTTTRQQNVLSQDSSDVLDISETRPVDEIPGPPYLPYFGTTYKHLPGGSYYKKNCVQQMIDRYNRYGPIVKECPVPGFDVVWLYDPDDIAYAYRNEAKYPERPGLDCLIHYRRRRGLPIGMTNAQGEEWHRIRRQVQQPMLKPSSINRYLPAQDNIADEFIDVMRARRDSDSEIPDMLNELRKWALESVAVVCFNKRVGALEAENTIAPQIQQYVDSIMKAMPLMHELTNSIPLYKIIKTSTFTNFSHHMDIIWDLTTKFTSEYLKQNEGMAAEDNMLSHLLSCKHLSADEIIAFILSMLFAGIDTTGNTVAFNLFLLAKNPSAQQELQNEIDRIVPKGSPVTTEILNNMPYLKAVCKETSRLMPTAGSSLRKLQKDIILKGYHIPAGYHLMFGHPAISMMPEYFESPEEFQPHRWIPSSAQKIHPFAVMPFGHGPRMCVGRRIAEQELYLMLVKIMQNFQVEYDHEPIGLATRLINAPDKPLRCRFVDRN